MASTSEGSRSGLNLKVLYEPRSIAVVGASPRPGKRGRTLIDNLTAAGYQGQILAVNPNYEEVLGLRCYPSLAALPMTPDVAAICLPSSAAVAALEDCGRAGIPGSAIVAGGFAETGAEGLALQDRIREVALTYGLTVAGPNSLGVVNRAAHVCYWAGLRYSDASSGIAAVIQSGALALSTMSVLFERGIFLEAAAMPGNEAVVTASDHLEYLIAQERVRIIALVLDGVRDPVGFVRAARAAAAAGKRIVIVKVGRSAGGRRAAAAHTASMTGADAVFDAVCRDLGVIRVDDMDELMETAILASRLHVPPRPRVVVTSVSGAGCGVASDLAERAGLTLSPPSEETAKKIAVVLPGTTPANPLDVALAFDVPGSYRACMETLATSGEYDLQLTVINCPRSNDSNQEFDRSQVADASSVARQHGQALAITSFASGQYDDGMISIANAANVPLLQGLRESLVAIRRLADASRQTEPAAGPFRARQRRNSVSPGLAGELQGEELLARYGIPMPPSRLVTRVEELAAACVEIGYPVALKASSRSVPHKTDVGGVVLNVGDAATAEAAYAEITSAVLAGAPGAVLEGVEVQKMVEGVAEVVVAIQRDPQFGPVLVVGTGGTLVEVLQDAVLTIPPVTPSEATAILESLRGYPLLAGARGRPRADIRALVEAIVRLSELAVDYADSLESLELNPLVVMRSGEGVVAVDLVLSQSDSA